MLLLSASNLKVVLRISFHAAEYWSILFLCPSGLLAYLIFGFNIDNFIFVGREVVYVFSIFLKKKNGSLLNTSCLGVFKEVAIS